MTLIYLFIGLLLLILGAESLVRGASNLAFVAGISPLVIGLTVVAYGTSTPEMFVSVMSGLRGQADIALGNVVGSNIFNVFFILGISALIVPLAVSRQLVRIDVPLMIGVSVITLLLCTDGKIGRADGIVLFLGIIVYTVFLIIQSRKELKDIRDEYTKEYGGSRPGYIRSWKVNVVLIFAGLVFLVLGARWLVNGAVFMAQMFGVSELVIGLTIVAAGTSLPEVATSIVASIRGERDIAVGNVVGSNIFNILAVLGLSSIVAPDGINVSPAALHFDIPVMIAVAIACLPVFFTGNVIARWEGVIFLGYYAAYTLYLVLQANQHATLQVYSAAMAWFVLPLTVLTLVIVSIRELRKY